MRGAILPFFEHRVSPLFIHTPARFKFFTVELRAQPQATVNT